jgi:hypothetical protein
MLRQQGLDDAHAAVRSIGQGCSGAFGFSGFVVAALMTSSGMSDTASRARIRATLLARVGLVSRP